MTTVTQKGQVTIPKEVRKILDIKQGDEIIFNVEQEKAILRKKKKSAQFQRYIGFLKNKEGQKVDKIISNLREGNL